MFDHLVSKFIHRRQRSQQRKEQGQSLVEMAIITPLLIFLLLGVFEVGNAVRNYMVLVNVNR
ncbi:MAG: pilus assembly protein, partial [Anaerolineae bacterium]|nr:pilus assembly protein [Anaerolineae bacterium]